MSDELTPEQEAAMLAVMRSDPRWAALARLPMGQTLPWHATAGGRSHGMGTRYEECGCRLCMVTAHHWNGDGEPDELLQGPVS